MVTITWPLSTSNSWLSFIMASMIASSAWNVAGYAPTSMVAQTCAWTASWWARCSWKLGADFFPVLCGMASSYLKLQVVVGNMQQRFFKIVPLRDLFNNQEVGPQIS